MIGTTLSHFRVTAKLGEGGMGEVYRAEDSKLGRDVAIKVLPEAVASDPERLARFEREAKVLASLNHPNIAAIYSLESAETAGGVGEPLAGSRTVRFLVMELVDGATLQELIEKGVAPDQALDWLRLQRTLAFHPQAVGHALREGQRRTSPASLSRKPLQELPTDLMCLPSCQRALFPVVRCCDTRAWF